MEERSAEPAELVVVSRFRVAGSGGFGGVGGPGGFGGSGGFVGFGDAGGFADAVQAAHAALAVRPGYVRGHVGQNLDDPELWVLTTTWTNVGSYRRALSSYDVKVTAVPLLSQAIDEPSAYETVQPGATGNQQRPRVLD